MCSGTNISEVWKEIVLRQVTGTMALSGLDLTDEDKARIRYLLDHPEEKDAMLRELIEKHCVK